MPWQPVIETFGLDGEPRQWGVCERCGQVDELAPSQVLQWEYTPLCAGCETEAVYEPLPTPADLDILPLSA